MARLPFGRGTVTMETSFDASLVPRGPADPVHEAAAGREGPPAPIPVRTVVRSDGRRRVVVLRQASGWFTFVEEAGYDVDIAGFEGDERRRWATLPSGSGIHGTAAEAGREAKAAIGWLRDEPTN